MKKRIQTLLSLCLLAAVLTTSALADAIWVPMDDFFLAHEEECDYLGRSYYVNGEAGYETLHEAPGAAAVTALRNGTPLYVSFTYEEGGDTWGVVEYGQEKATGWVLMDAMVLIYDGQAFDEEYAAEFVPYDDSFSQLLHSQGQRVIVWTYPGSGEMDGDFETLDPEYGPLEVDVTWTDEAGLVWGRVAYYMGYRGWVCLSDSGNDALPVRQQAYELTPPVDPPAQALTPTTPFPLWIIAGVGGLCLVTACILLCMRRKKS